MNTQNNYCDISEHCKLLCEANKNYNEALQYIGKTELEKEQLRYQISLLRFDNMFYNSVVIKPKRVKNDEAIMYEISENEYERYKKMQYAISEIEKIDVYKPNGINYNLYANSLERALKTIKQIINNLNSENIEIEESTSDDFGLYGYGAKFGD